MSNQFFSKIWIIVILIVFVAGGVLAWQYWWEPKEETEKETQLGVIEGSLGYPSDFIPSDMKVCAENIATQKEYCTDKHIKDSKYTYGEGYKIEVPPGNYYIFATLPTRENYKAYYSEFVICGLKIDCTSHKSIIVKVNEKQVASNIDPQDWYKTTEAIVGNETANWKIYNNIQLGFEAKYPQTWSVSMQNGVAVFDLPNDKGKAGKGGVESSIPVAIWVSRDSKKYSSLSDLENFLKAELQNSSTNYSIWNYSSISQKTIGNNNFLVYSWMHQAQGINYQTLSNGNPIEITFRMDDAILPFEQSKNYSDFLKFLETLKFTI